MKKLICLGLATIVISLVAGCSISTPLESLEGVWDLESVTDKRGEILSVGKAYNSYYEWEGHKDDMRIFLDGGQIFKITSFEESFLGTYKIDHYLSNKDTIAISLQFYKGHKVGAVCGTRQNLVGEEVNSLLFTLGGRRYSFVKPKDN